MSRFFFSLSANLLYRKNYLGYILQRQRQSGFWRGQMGQLRDVKGITMKIIARKATLGSGRQILEGEDGKELCTLRADGRTPEVRCTPVPQAISNGGRVLYRAQFRQCQPVWVLTDIIGTGIVTLYERDDADEHCADCGRWIGGQFAGSGQKTCDVCRETAAELNGVVEAM